MRQVQLLVVRDTMKALGISKEKLTKLLLLSTLFLIALLSFVFVGVSAFTTGTSFSGVVNSIIPLAGTAGLYLNQNFNLNSIDFDAYARRVFQARRALGVSGGVRER